MKKKPANTNGAAAIGRRSGVAGIGACVIYIAVCLYLYHPYLSDPERDRCIIMANSVIGAVGCFALSRRWIGTFIGSLFAGALYGFCPLAFGLASYHPLAGVPLAFLPWLFCPAAFWRKYAIKHNRRVPPNRFGGMAITTTLCLIPFLAVIIYFLLCSKPPISVLPVPLEKLRMANFAGLIAPLAIKPHDFVLSVYHVPLPACLMGLCMAIASKRTGIMVIAGCAIVLAFSKPIFNQVPPVVWAMIPMLVVSILVGLGMEAFAWAGAADRQWVLFCAAATAVIAAGCLYLTATKGLLYRPAAVMHTLAVVMVCIVYFLERARLRLHAVRWTLLAAAMGLDILLCSRYIVAGIFG